jgi:hypothetical protein
MERNHCGSVVGLLREQRNKKAIDTLRQGWSGLCFYDDAVPKVERFLFYRSLRFTYRQCEVYRYRYLYRRTQNGQNRSFTGSCEFGIKVISERKMESSAHSSVEKTFREMCKLRAIFVHEFGNK